MSLFLINRYLGDEDDSIQSTSESRSKSLLAKLQEQARARQQLQASAKQEELETTGVSPGTRTKRNQDEEAATDERATKKKSKRKADQPLGDESLSVETTKVEDSLPSKKKKRKEKPEKIKESLVKKKQKQKVTTPETTEKLVDEEEEEKDDEDAIKGTEEHAEQLSSSDRKMSDSGFTILGGFESKPVQKVQMVLPQWLAKPDMFQRDISQNLVPINEVQGICPHLLKKLDSNGIQHFFPVQAEVIPAILEGVSNGLLVGRGGYKPRDICVSAPTGSGKTLAFVVPVVQALLKRVLCEVRVLVVLPTKELAQQVGKVFHSYVDGTNLKVVMLIGQKSLAAEQASLVEQSGSRYRSLADIVVATPGRLVDHINMTSGFSLQHLRFLVIDEADRMIDSMHQSWLSQVTKAVYSGSDGSSVFGRKEPGPITALSLIQPQMPLQKLLFSATLTQNPEKLQQLGLYRPRLFSSAHRGPASDNGSAQPEEKFIFPPGLTEFYVPCTLSKKPLLILHFILHLKFSPVLCFTNSREAAHRLCLLVQLFGGVQVAEFSSQLSPSERKRALKGFEQGKIQLLISTDAAARGIDMVGVKYVINYDAPQFIRTYVHRVGRTARAGKAGLAFTFLLGIQERRFLQMLSDAGSPGIQKQIIKPENLKAMESHFERTLLELKKVIKDERAKKKQI
ncbi:ATP-dependent RNA helicase DDX51 [Brienomyrus brachyistius]|uniref:ATP-dependent RNA helicase DDX51 n=1 Tax=Brienomyrus brachyistius TaxID=42636 RepID=UPI0020B2D58C|nr:ATP-dependent RNA helicase DDX51 [Brienomyrus brachyistius]